MLAAAGRSFIILHYGWGMFSISCTDFAVRMRRSGEDRRLMRQGVGMYVRRHFRTALEKDGWQVGGEGGVVSVACEGRTLGRFRSAQNKFMENGTLELSQSAKPKLASLLSVLLGEICEDPDRLTAELCGSLDAVITSARTLGVAEDTCFAYGTLGSDRGSVADGRVLELMGAMSTIGSDGDFVCYPHLRWQEPGLEAEGTITLEMKHRGKWTVSIALSESSGMSVPNALAAIVARFESASS